MEQPPPISETPPATPKPPAMSLMARLLNVFASPGEVFDDIKASLPVVSNWLVPALLFALVGVISSIVMFSQPAIVQQIHEQQAKKMDELVKAGKMSQADADKAAAVAEKFTGPTMLTIFGSVAITIISFVRLLWWGLLLWLVGKAMKKPIGYAKALEIFGLASMITVLGAVVTILLTVILGRMIATPSLALIVKDFDVTRKSHLLLGTVNVFYFWQIGVLSVGLAKVTGAPFMRALLLVLTCWVLQELVLIFTGMGQMAL
jgi:mannitol-specific phosphotransferase system IIBC component